MWILGYPGTRFGTRGTNLGSSLYPGYPVPGTRENLTLLSELVARNHDDFTRSEIGEGFKLPVITRERASAIPQILQTSLATVLQPGTAAGLEGGRWCEFWPTLFYRHWQARRFNLKGCGVVPAGTRTAVVNWKPHW
eukprot:1145264-Rhodomonas_salina.2